MDAATLWAAPRQKLRAARARPRSPTRTWTFGQCSFAAVDALSVRALGTSAITAAAVSRKQFISSAGWPILRRTPRQAKKSTSEGELRPGWRDVQQNEVFIPACPHRFIHFLGGAFVGASPRLFYETFIEKLAEECEAIVITTPYQLSFDYQSMADAVAQELEAVKRQLPPYELPVIAVGHSCGALLHALNAGGGQYEACALLSFNNKPISDAIPVPLPEGPENPRVREMLKSNIEAVLAGDSVEEGLKAARLLQGTDERKAAAVVSQFGPLLTSVVDGQKEFSMSCEDVANRLSVDFSTPTLVVQFANDFTDDSKKLFACIRQAGAEAQLVRFPGGHTTPLDSALGGKRQEQLAAKIAAFIKKEDLPEDLPGANVREEACRLREQLLRLCAGYNRGFAPLPPGQGSDIITCIEEIEALQSALQPEGASLSSMLEGKWRLIWATSPDVLLLTSLPSADCGEIRQDIDAQADRLEVINTVELSPRGAGLLGVALPEIARALTIVSKVKAQGDLADNVLTLQLQEANLEPVVPGTASILELLPALPLPASSPSIRLLTTFVDNELRISRSPLGDVFMFSRL